LLFIDCVYRPLGFALTLGRALATFLDLSHSQSKILWPDFSSFGGARWLSVTFPTRISAVMSASDGSKGAYRCHFDTIRITGGNERRKCAHLRRE